MLTLLAASLAAVASGTRRQRDPLEKQAWGGPTLVDQQAWHCLSAETRASAH